MLFWINFRPELKFRRLFHKPWQKMDCHDSLLQADFSILSPTYCPSPISLGGGVGRAGPLTGCRRWLGVNSPQNHDLNFRKMETSSKNVILEWHCHYLVKYLSAPKGKYFRFLGSEKLGRWETWITTRGPTAPHTGQERKHTVQTDH